MGASVPSNYKLVTDLVSDLSTRHRADSQGLLPGDLGISMRIKQESAERLEPGVAGNGKLGNLCVCVCSFSCFRDAAICASVSKRPHLCQTK